MSKPKPFFVCPHCKRPFFCKSYHPKWCSLACAFWSRVTPTKNDECWPWTGSKHVFGYGEFKFNGKLYRSHRVAYELKFGNILPQMKVLHHCDNPSCCNPEHLYLGLQDQNMSDMATRNRNTKNRKLTPDDIPIIRELSSSGVPKLQIAKKFHVAFSQIASVLSHRTWKHIP